MDAGKLISALFWILLRALPAAAQDEGSGPGLIEQPLPPFSLTTLDGTEISTDSVDGYILILHFFSRVDVGSLLLGDEIDFFHGRGREDEIRYLGVSPLAEDPLRTVVAQQGWSHALASDPGGKVTRDLLGSERQAVLVVDHRGVVRFFSDTFDAGFRTALRSTLRDRLRELEKDLASLPRPEIRWRERPPAPIFAAPDLEGKVRTSAEFRGKPLLVYFFEEDCQNCGESTAIVRDAVAVHGKNGLQVVGVMTRTDRDTAVRHARERGLRIPILLDPEGEIRRRFGAVSGNPDFYWIDSDGTLRWRELGTPEGMRDLTNLRAGVLVGTADRSAFLPGRYVGFRACRTCHEAEFQDWLATPHAVAGQSVNGDRKDVCLQCHVTGLKKPGGHDPVMNPDNMFQVQCEACHGPGGGHGQPEEATGQFPWQARCITCHMGPYELEQPFEESFRWMQHRNTPAAETLFAYLPERREHSDRFIAARETVTGFRAGTRYVGSLACRECHAKIYQRWSKSPHALALDSLRDKDSLESPDCLGCHVTAPGLITGYRGRSTPGLAGVGCESCHGPGEDHVEAPEPLRTDAIYGLTSDCGDCRVEATCRACHDPVNDPDFRMPEGRYHKSAARGSR